MLMKDKTASSIKRKVQVAKQRVDKDNKDAVKLLDDIGTFVEDAQQDVEDLTIELEVAEATQAGAEADLVVAVKGAKIAASKRFQVTQLIDRFEVDLQDLLDA